MSPPTGEQLHESLTDSLHRANSALSLAQEIYTALHRYLWRPAYRFADATTPRFTRFAA